MVNISIDTKKVDQQIDAVDKAIVGAIVESVKQGMDYLGQQQVETYTQDDGPPKPAGSPYVRTFALQDSSEKEMTSTRPPLIQGEWSATVEYAKYVIGDRDNQAAIHQGRWMGVEELEEQLNIELEKILEKEISEALR